MVLTVQISIMWWFLGWLACQTIELCKCSYTTSLFLSTAVLWGVFCGSYGTKHVWGFSTLGFKLLARLGVVIKQASAFGLTSVLLMSVPDRCDVFFPPFIAIDTTHPVQFPFQRDRAPASADWILVFPVGFLLQIKDSENEPAQETRDYSTKLLLLVTTLL